MRPSLESAQYPSTAYGEPLAAYQMRQSVGRPGTCWDNAVAESFFATLKAELIYRHSWPTRRHSALGFLSPADVERRTSPVTLAA